MIHYEFLRWDNSDIMEITIFQMYLTIELFFKVHLMRLMYHRTNFGKCLFKYIPSIYFTNVGQPLRKIHIFLILSS